MNGLDPRAMPEFVRPIRIPERVPLALAQPEVALAGEKSTWRMSFELCEDIAEGDCLKLQLDGKRNNHGVFRPAQVDQPGSDGFVTARVDGGPELNLMPDKAEANFIVDVPAGGLAAGRRILVALANSEAPAGRLLNKFVVLYRPDAPDRLPTQWNEETQPWLVAACMMHVLGGPTDHLRAYAPSQAEPGATFEVLVRPEDSYGNLSHEPLNDMGAFVDGRELDCEVEPLADSACVRLTLRLDEEGVFRIGVRDRESGRETVANPTICRSDAGKPAVLWGMIHGHSEMSDGTGNIDYYFRQIRDEAALDFAAPGDHDHLYETSDAMWRVTCEAVKRYNDPGRFVTLLGYEWAKWRQNGDGDRNVYYPADDRPMYRSDDDEHPTPPDLFRALEDETAMVIPHHPGHMGNFCDYKDHDAECERLIEIFQVRGSYECSEEDGNPVPERGDQPPYPDGYVRRALALGWRAGFTAGGDDHTGHAGTDYPFGPCKAWYRAGLMSVPARERTREAVWQALWDRRVVATTGPRMILDYELSGRPLGSELNAEEMPELRQKRELRIEFHGTAPIDRIDVIRNNQEVHTARPGGMDCELTWVDDTPLAQVLMPAAKFHAAPFCFYYVRVVQTDNEVAWASPVWIDP